MKIKLTRKISILLLIVSSLIFIPGIGRSTKSTSMIIRPDHGILAEQEDSVYTTQIINVDLTGDGLAERIMINKSNGTGSLLSFLVTDSKGNILLKCEGIYKGTVEIYDNKIIEKEPVYDTDDSNALPSKYRYKEYSFDQRGLVTTSIELKSYSEQNKFISAEQESVTGDYWENPSREDIERLLEEVAVSKGIPPAILKAIAYTESNLRQFHKGKPLLSFDGVSWGIMQVTPAFHPELDEERVKYDIKYNIEAGAEILLSKWAYAYSKNPVIPVIGDGDPRVLENWYFAIWAYNGWKESNNPNMIPYKHSSWVQTEAYQEKVLRYAREEFNQEITSISPDVLPQRGLPSPQDIYHTPLPKHSYHFKLFPSGQIVISDSTSGIVLRNDNWQSIKTIKYGVELEVLDGPVLYNGYLRYKVKEVLNGNLDGSIGWVALNWLKEKPTNLVKIEELPGGGQTVIIDKIGFDRNYLKEKFKELKYAFENDNVYVKIAEKIYIDRYGELVDLNIIPQTIEYRGFLTN